jgi:hypothetical protein
LVHFSALAAQSDHRTLMDTRIVVHFPVVAAQSDHRTNNALPKNLASQL